MATFKALCTAYMAALNPEPGAVSRLGFWIADPVGAMECADITPEHIDEALRRLCERGRLKTGRNMRAERVGELSGATINRYQGQAGQVFKWAKGKTVRALPRAYQIPTRGIEREEELQDPERYLRTEEVARILKVARVLDTRWGKMPALIVVAFHTGLRVSSILNVKGKDLDLKAGTMKARTATRGLMTKNNDAITAALSEEAIAELRKLPKVQPEELVFGNRSGQAFTYRPLWDRCAKAAGLEGRNFHQLRHGHGTVLAQQGVSTPMIMASMGQRTLKAAARYLHHNTKDKADVIARVSPAFSVA